MTAICKWCGSDGDECLYTQCHDMPKDEDHAPCGAFIPTDDDSQLQEG